MNGVGGVAQNLEKSPIILHYEGSREAYKTLQLSSQSCCIFRLHKLKKGTKTDGGSKKGSFDGQKVM